MATKPMLFGDNYNEAKFDPRNRTAMDPSRIGGYSEIVQANDINKADDLQFREAHKGAAVIKTKEDAYKVIGAQPQKLPVNFAWLRINGPGGAHSPTAAAEIDQYTNDRGFVLCTKERFDALSEAYGYKFNHNSWTVAEDGTIRRGYDVALYYRSGDVARMWDSYMAEEAVKAEADFPQALSAANVTTETFTENSTEEILITH